MHYVRIVTPLNGYIKRNSADDNTQNGIVFDFGEFTEFAPSSETTGTFLLVKS